MKIEYIKLIVEQETGLNLSKNSRRREYVESRMIYFKLCKDYSNYSLTSIGSLVNRDHASVIHGLRKFNTILNQSEYLRNKYTLCLDNLTESISDGFMEINDIDILKINYKNKLEATNIKHKEEIKKVMLYKALEHPILDKLSKLSEDILQELYETRMKPFLRMRNIEL